MDNCSQFNFNSFKYSDYNPYDFGNDIDPEFFFIIIYHQNVSITQIYNSLRKSEKLMDYPLYTLMQEV